MRPGRIFLTLRALTVSVLMVLVPAASQSALYSGYSEVVIMANNGQILIKEKEENLRYPASLTKMMTIYLAFRALNSGTMTKIRSSPYRRKR